jgi:hypothetical protein
MKNIPLTLLLAAFWAGLPACDRKTGPEETEAATAQSLAEQLAQEGRTAEAQTQALLAEVKAARTAEAQSKALLEASQRPQNATGAADAWDELEEMKVLHDRLAGTTWLHNYNGGEFPFTFGRDGTIENHSSWEGQPWRVVSSSEVIVGEKASQGKMIFTFNDDVTSFVNLDWDGTPTSGERK